MKVKKIPMRTCVVTKEKCEKKDLLRIVRNKEEGVVVDLTGKKITLKNPDQTEIKKDLSVLEKAKKSKVLEKHLECEIPESIYEEIKEIINK